MATFQRSQESLLLIKQSSPQAVDDGLERLRVPRTERLATLAAALPPLLLLLVPHGELAERVVTSSGAAALVVALTTLQAERTCCQAERTQASCKRAASLCEAFANRAEQQGKRKYNICTAHISTYVYMEEESIWINMECVYYCYNLLCVSYDDQSEYIFDEYIPDLLYEYS